MNRSLMALAIVLAWSIAAPAQQQELNSVGGSLTSGGAHPVVGAPFIVPTSGSLNVEIGGAPNAPFALVLGSLATTSLQVGALVNQFWDLDLTAQTIVMGDGIGGSGILPPAFFLLGSSGRSAFSFPANPALAGVTVAMQGVVQDPALAPSNLNLTAAAAFSFTNATVFSGDAVRNFVFPSGPYTFFGTSYTDIDVSSNGWIRFGGGSAHSDPVPSLAAFLGGTVGTNSGGGGNPGGTPGGGGTGGGTPAPVLAVLWNALDMTAGQTTIDEVTPGRTVITWRNGTYLGSSPGSFGTFSCTIDRTSGVVLVTLDYSAFNHAAVLAPFTESIVGSSDGANGTGALATEVDIVRTGAVIPVAPAAGGGQMIFQDFAGFGTVAAEANDLSGQTVNFLDATGAGNFSMF